MQDEGDTEFVVGEFGEKPVHQFRIGPEEGIGFPGGVDRDEFVAGVQPEVFSVVEPAGRTGEEAVVAGVTGEEGEREGVGAAFAQPGVLLVVGQRDGAGDQAPLVFEGAVGKPEDLLVPGSWFLVPGSWFLVPGSTAYCIRCRGEFSGSWILSRVGYRRGWR
ncbi:hypothetical protein GCM10009642_08310 [Nocardiopsis metallicus]